jgi:hypothetical protein
MLSVSSTRKSLFLQDERKSAAMRAISIPAGIRAVRDVD